MASFEEIQIFVLSYPEVKKEHIEQVFGEDFFTFVCCGADSGYNLDYRAIPDNSGENISRYNKFINENTGTFFVGTHLEELNHRDYVGFMQYSKIFCIKQECLGEKTIMGAFLRNGLTVLQKFKILNLVYFDELFEEFSRRLKKKNPEYFSDNRTSFETYLEQNESIHFNMFVVHVDIFRKWFDVMRDGFSVVLQMIDNNCHGDFSDLHQRMQRERIEISERTVFGNKRIYAFLMEIFSGYAFFFISRGWSNEYTYIPCRFIGFDSSKKKIHPV